MYRIERLVPPVSDADVRQLAELLADTVNGGGAVSFLPPLDIESAERFWRATMANLHQRAIVLVARESEVIVGSVQMHPSWAPNQPHRADIAKLLVHRSARRRGVGRQLMSAIEAAAGEEKFTLLTLDTRRGDAAEELYRKSGWVEVGVIPRYALNADGTFHDTVVFYKEMGRGGLFP